MHPYLSTPWAFYALLVLIAVSAALIIVALHTKVVHAELAESRASLAKGEEEIKILSSRLVTWRNEAERQKAIADLRLVDLNAAKDRHEDAEKKLQAMYDDLAGTVRDRDRLKTEYHIQFDARASLQTAFEAAQNDAAHWEQMHDLLRSEYDAIALDRRMFWDWAIALGQAPFDVTDDPERFLDEARARLAHVVSHYKAWAREGA